MEHQSVEIGCLAVKDVNRKGLRDFTVLLFSIE